MHVSELCGTTGKFALNQPPDDAHRHAHASTGNGPSIDQSIPASKSLASIDAAVSLGWELAVDDGSPAPAQADHDKLVAAAQTARRILVLTGAPSNLLVVELRQCHGYQLAGNHHRMTQEDFPVTWTAKSPIRTLLFFDLPGGSLPTSTDVLGIGVTVHGERSTVPLVDADGWRGFQWAKRRAPGQVALAELPWPYQLQLRTAADCS